MVEAVHRKFLLPGGWRTGTCVRRERGVWMTGFFVKAVAIGSGADCVDGSRKVESHALLDCPGPCCAVACSAGASEESPAAVADATAPAGGNDAEASTDSDGTGAVTRCGPGRRAILRW